jgi:serine/threonine protein phosphatase PrpC
MVPDAQIATVLQSSATPQAASQELVRLANEQGGRDNVTVVVARYS